MTTKETIFNAAYKIAETQSIQDVTSPEIHRVSGIKRPSIFYHFKTIDNLRNAIVTKAVKDENMKILRQLLTTGCLHTESIDNALRTKIIKSFL